MDSSEVWPLRPLSVLELALTLASWLRVVIVSKMDMASLVEVVAGAETVAVKIVCQREQDIKKIIAIVFCSLCIVLMCLYK